MFAGRGAHDAAKRRERGVAMETQMATKEPAKKSAIENKVDVIASLGSGGLAYSQDTALNSSF
jgi:hypothetical protein